MSFEPLVSAVYDFDQAPFAVERVIQNEGDRIKVLLKF